MLIPRPLQRGMSLVELMVGIAVGIVVVLAITQFFVGQFISNTDMLKATRLNQELRAVMDLTVRDVRRGGYRGDAIRGVWYEGTPGVTPNPLQSITIGSTVNPTASTSGTSIAYSYDINASGTVEDAENFTIQLNNNAVELVQGITSPTTTQLSDPASTTIANLTFTLDPRCVDSAPVLTWREITIALTGRLASDATVTRTLHETVRVRADHLGNPCPTPS
jgi:type II secretory pathway component PulJ